MTGKRTPSAKTLRVKVKDDKVTITFNARNWNPAHGELLDFLAYDAETEGIPVAEYIGHAITLKGMDIATSQEAFDRLMRAFEKLVAEEINSRALSGEIDHDNPEP